ncbi:nucleotide exchange factor GrpE [Sporolactobacillus sp. THM7-4]|nr:nucleotide exchange factor GrpE [Sporolactobacillus sp. THM7-4]
MAKQANEEKKDEKSVTDNDQVQLEEEKVTKPSEPKSEQEANDTPSDQAGPQDGGKTDERLEQQAAEIEALKKEKNDLNNRWLRAQADFENYKKRVNKEKAEARKYRAQDLAVDMLEILDNFKRALAVKTESEDGKALKKGMEMVLNSLESALKKEGVEEIDAQGKPFDPHKHQAVMQEKSEEYDSGTVIQVLQAGYMLNGRVIRPAMVKVSS